MLKKILFVILFLSTAMARVQAEVGSEFGDLEFPYEDQLLRAAFEVGLLSGMMRGLPSNPNLNVEGTLLSDEGFRDRFQKATTLFNFVCAQVYVNHLTDLRVLGGKASDPVDINPNNYYNKNPLRVSPHPMHAVSRRASQLGAKLVAEGRLDEILSMCEAGINHLEAFLCPEFERSYRELFHLEKAAVGDVQNPYYDFFCKVSEDVKNKVDL